MNRSLLIPALLLLLGLAACDRPTVVAVPVTPAPEVVAVPVPVPGPAGPPGATGAPGNTGDTGAAGKPGSGTTVVVMPAASAPSN